MIRINFTQEDSPELLEELELEYSEEILERALEKKIPEGLMWQGLTLREAFLTNPHSPSPFAWYSGVQSQQSHVFIPKTEEETKIMLACRYILKYFDEFCECIK